MSETVERVPPGTIHDIDAHQGWALTRHDPGRADRTWRGNPYWVRLKLDAGPVEDYLTLTDGGREIELGAFLSPEERRALYTELAAACAAAGAAATATVLRVAMVEQGNR